MMSSGKFPDPRRIRNYRRNFADRWSGFLRANYTSTAHVAICFGVDESTARSWWGGITAPSGYAVAIAFKDHPDAAADLLDGGRGWMIARACLTALSRGTNWPRPGSCHTGWGLFSRVAA